MPNTLTPWGYEVVGSVPPLLTLDGFHDMTGDKFVSDERIQSAIDAATARMRSYCGWHVAGSLQCVATIDGGERTVWLPSACVTDVASVTVLGTDVTDSCEWSRRGQLRLPYSPDRLGAVVVEFTSGYPEVPQELAALVAHRVIHEVALPFGVQQETAGSVSISYSQSASNDAGGVVLTVRDKQALSAYRLEEAR